MLASTNLSSSRPNRKANESVLFSEELGQIVGGDPALFSEELSSARHNVGIGPDEIEPHIDPRNAPIEVVRAGTKLRRGLAEGGVEGSKVSMNFINPADSIID